MPFYSLKFILITFQLRARNTDFSLSFIVNFTSSTKLLLSIREHCNANAGNDKTMTAKTSIRQAMAVIVVKIFIIKSRMVGA